MKKQYRGRFRALTAVQIAFLVASILFFAWSLVATDYVAVPFVSGLVIALQVAGLIRHVESHVDTLEEFFSAVNYDDLTRRFVEDDVDADLKRAFNHILAKFQNARAEREVQADYLETVVRHVPVPFIATRSGGVLTLMNNPARHLTGMPTLSHLGQLTELDPALPALMQSIEPGGQRLMQTKLRGVPAELRVSVSEIRMASGVERLYSIENLSGELSAREASAWRNLIRVLTHEIMNTLTPVTSLAQTVTSLLDQPNAKDDVRDAAQTIARRSEELTNFVLRYRELMRVPQPVPATLSVSAVLRSIETLMTGQLDGVTVAVNVTPVSLEVTADPTLLNQVLVNLVRNALDAMADVSSPALELCAALAFGRVRISVKDNGTGIDADAVEQIFVPFFTTKREGSGIGLSLCRQIMTAHGGEIAVDTSTAGTTINLVF